MVHTLTPGGSQGRTSRNLPNLHDPSGAVSRAPSDQAVWPYPGQLEPQAAMQPDPYPITTGQLVLTSAKEIGKVIPILGNILSAGDAVFSKIEANRVRVVLASFANRIGALEGAINDQVKAAELILFACDQARHDPLAAPKADAYGAVLAYSVTSVHGIEELAEIIENLRKVNTTDIKSLLQFRSDAKSTWDSRFVRDLAGYQSGIDPFGGQGTVENNMPEVLSSLLRLQALGVLYLTRGANRMGGPVLDIGVHSDSADQIAFLTLPGKRLVLALPQ